MIDSLLAYAAVFVGALVPWFELFVIPPAIALGLNPIAVGALAFAGNAMATMATIVWWQRLTAWWQRRRGRTLGAGSRRGARGLRVFDRYGVPGLALQGPVLTGIYLAVVLALSLGASRRGVVAWSLTSLAAWTIGLVAATVAGVSLVTG